MSSPNGDGKRVKIVRLGTLPPAPPVKWIWKPYLAYGCLTLTEGEEGIGKGYLAAWLAVRVAKSGRAVIWLTSEERSEKIQARLEMLGYDPAGDSPIIQLMVTDDTLVTMPRDRSYFLALAKQLGVPIGLIVVDVLRDHSAPTEEMNIRYRSNNDEAWIKPAARSWERLAETLGAAVLGLHHRNKSLEGTARTKSTGSGAWRQNARHVVTLAKVGDQCALAMDKTNITKEDKEPISYTLDVVKLGVDEDGDDVTEAIFRPGQRTGCFDINDWERQARKASEISATEFIEVAIRDKYKPGEIITKADLEQLLPLNDRQMRQSLKALTAEGILTFVRGRGYLLNPERTG